LRMTTNVETSSTAMTVRSRTLRVVVVSVTGGPLSRERYFEAMGGDRQNARG
jgi:hypothetical protein